MRRIVEFNDLDTEYVFFENEKNVFEISKTELQFDAKKFYQAFFSNGKDFTEIELREPENMDKKAKHVFSTVKLLFREICDRLNEEFKDEVNQKKGLEENKKEEDE